MNDMSQNYIDLMYLTNPSNMIKMNKIKEEKISPEEKKKYKELQRKANKCSRTCKDIEKQQMKKHKSKYSKEYRVINKALKENCCKCHYVKSNNSLKIVRGPWSHCSYDMDNCCKDKKTIVKSKK